MGFSTDYEGFHFKNHPHGTQVQDAKPLPFVDKADGTAGTSAEGYFFGYLDCATIGAADDVEISATSDIEIVNGKPRLKAGAVWAVLGKVGDSGFLRLERVRYAVVKDTAGAALTFYLDEHNPVAATASPDKLDG